MRIVLVSLGLLALAGCASSPQPLIDHINVSDAKYNKDMADCRAQTKGSWMPFSGGSLPGCMKGKGYRVLMGSTGL